MAFDQGKILAYSESVLRGRMSRTWVDVQKGYWENHAALCLESGAWNPATVTCCF